MLVAKDPLLIVFAGLACMYRCCTNLSCLLYTLDEMDKSVQHVSYMVVDIIG